MALAAPGTRRHHLALVCVTALCRDMAARGRTASWTCSRDDRAGRLRAWSAGFRLTREYVHYATGRVRPPARPVAKPARPRTGPAGFPVRRRGGGAVQ
ncbi:hypothetical protein AB0O22_11465 [Streptomyces sp. NPDC091204]|uniref:hypothetical protein n=1 Tax=Streptomyces sp. NPDC091204 TaxID=3155299 RepID=UPI0034420418